MNAPRLPNRDNLLERRFEKWLPPAFEPPGGRWRRLTAALRRCFDLQAASIWQDLAVLLKPVRGTVVDVGCGAQPYRPLLAPDVQYLGLDTASARAHFGYTDPQTIYFEGQRWPVDSASANLVLATETLEHVPRPAEFLAEARRCLHSQGVLILTVPFAARWHYIPHDYWRFAPSGLRLLLEDAGFHDVVVYARGNALTVACYKCMALILALLLGGPPSWMRIFGRLLGLASSPLLIALALVGRLSLHSRGGDDCLGYTVVASPVSPRHQERV